MASILVVVLSLPLALVAFLLKFCIIAIYGLLALVWMYITSGVPESWKAMVQYYVSVHNLWASFLTKVFYGISGVVICIMLPLVYYGLWKPVRMVVEAFLITGKVMGNAADLSKVLFFGWTEMKRETDNIIQAIAATLKAEWSLNASVNDPGSSPLFCSFSSCLSSMVVFVFSWVFIVPLTLLFMAMKLVPFFLALILKLSYKFMDNVGMVGHYPYQLSNSGKVAVGYVVLFPFMIGPAAVSLVFLYACDIVLAVVACFCSIRVCLEAGFIVACKYCIAVVNEIDRQTNKCAIRFSNYQHVPFGFFNWCSPHTSAHYAPHQQRPRCCLCVPYTGPHTFCSKLWGLCLYGEDGLFDRQALHYAQKVVFLKDFTVYWDSGYSNHVAASSNYAEFFEDGNEKIVTPEQMQLYDFLKRGKEQAKREAEEDVAEAVKEMSSQPNFASTCSDTTISCQSLPQYSSSSSTSSASSLLPVLSSAPSSAALEVLSPTLPASSSLSSIPPSSASVLSTSASFSETSPSSSEGVPEVIVNIRD